MQVGELAGQQRHEYDPEHRAIVIRQPLKEVNGTLTKGGARSDHHHLTTSVTMDAVTTPGRRPKTKKGRTKTPTGTRVVELPASIAVFYETLIDSHPHPYVLCTPAGKPWRRSNFRRQHWRPVWDGIHPDKPNTPDHMPPILPWFTFHEGRHTHNTWLIEDGVPEIARRARQGQTMKGIGRIYDHVTPVMRRQILDALETRWLGSLVALNARERDQLVAWFPHLRTTFNDLGIELTLSPTPDSRRMITEALVS